MKKIISILTIIIMMIFALFSLTGCEKKNDGNVNGAEEAVSENGDAVKDWPDLTSDGIPNLTAGKIVDVIDNCNKNGYKLSYTITVKSIKKSDINKYIKSFKDWDKTESNGSTILINNSRAGQYSVVISPNEDDETATIIITSM